MNNRPDNLILLHRKDHFRLHVKRDLIIQTNQNLSNDDFISNEERRLCKKYGCSDIDEVLVKLKEIKQNEEKGQRGDY